MNKALIDKFNNYIEKNNIMFRRYVTNGDPIALLPFTTKSGNNSYYHPDDNNDKMSHLAISCKNIKKTNKVLCNLHNKTKKNKPHPKFHSVYLGILYKGAGEDLTKTTKEINRYNGNTVCRIITGGNNESYKSVFFLLDELKTSNKKDHSNFSIKIEKFKKIFTTDYKHQDIYMNTKIFNNLLQNSVILDDKNLNPIIFDKLATIEQTKFKPELYCL
jgi:hypothetical protein